MTEQLNPKYCPVCRQEVSQNIFTEMYTCGQCDIEGIRPLDSEDEPMGDIQIVSPANPCFRLEVWETNRGPEEGFYQWNVEENKGGWWVEVESCDGGWRTFDRALEWGRRALDSIVSESAGAE